MGYRKVSPCTTKFEHFGVIRFLATLQKNRQTDRQTNKQTDPNILPTQTDFVGEGNDPRSRSGSIPKSNHLILDPMSSTFTYFVSNPSITF